MPYKKMRKFFIFFIFFVSGCGDSLINIYSDIDSLEKVLPVLEKHQVVAIRNQDWCKVFGYSRGSYAWGDASNCIYPLSQPIESFDEQASTDFSEVWRALKKTGVDVIMIEKCSFDDQGKLVTGKFSRNGGYARHFYHYQRNYKNLPMPELGEVRFERIDGNWFYECRDLL